MLGASLVVAVLSPAVVLLSDVLDSWSFVSDPAFFNESLCATGIWVMLVLVALGRYEKRWRWFLIGAPFALYQPFAFLMMSVGCAFFGGCP
jgi:hypothetical protein